MGSLWEVVKVGSSSSSKELASGSTELSAKVRGMR